MRIFLHFFQRWRWACVVVWLRLRTLSARAGQEEMEMPYHWVEVLAVLAAGGLFAYLGYALLRPEKF